MCFMLCKLALFPVCVGAVAGLGHAIVLNRLSHRSKEKLAISKERKWKISAMPSRKLW